MDHSSTDRFFERVQRYSQAIPDCVGPYRVHGRVSSGGQGTIFRGTDTRNGADVALKRPCRVDSKAERRLRRGVQLVSLLDHPFILADHRIVENHNCLWIITPWIEGVTLDHWCLSGVRSAGEKTRLFLRICDAVAHAHARGVVHRDLRPANILVRKDDRPCLLDFGIAKRIEFPERTAVADSGGPAGDIHYLAPELLRTDAAVPDPRQDVYSLGMLLYTMHGGDHPFTGLPLAECLDRLASGTLFDRRVHRALPGSLGAIVRRGTSCDLSSRYQSVKDLVDDVRRDLDGSIVRARSYSRRYVCKRFVNRHRASALAIATAVLSGFALALLHHVAAEREQEMQDEHAEAINMYTDLVSTASPFSGSSLAGSPLEWLAFVSSQSEAARGDLGEGDSLAMALVQLSLAEAYFDLRRGDLGLQHARSAYSTRKRLLGATAHETREAGIMLARTLVLIGNIDQAEDCLIEVVGHNRFLEISDRSQMLLAGVIRSAQRRTDDAWILFEKSVELAAEGSPELAFILEMRGTHLNRAGRPVEGLSEIRTAHRIYREVYGPEDPRAIAARLFEVKSLQMMGRFGEVREILNEIMPIAERAFGRDDPRTIQGWAHLTIADAEIGDPQVALQRARDILDHSRRVFPDGHWNVVQAKFLVSHALLAIGEPRAVIDLWEGDSANYGGKHPSRLANHKPKLWLARAYNDLNAAGEALRVVDPALADFRDLLGPDHRTTMEFEFEQLRAAAQAGLATATPQQHAEFADRCASVYGSEHPFARRAAAFAASSLQARSD